MTAAAGKHTCVLRSIFEFRDQTKQMATQLVTIVAGEPCDARSIERFGHEPLRRFATQWHPVRSPAAQLVENWAAGCDAVRFSSPGRGEMGQEFSCDSHLLRRL